MTDIFHITHIRNLQNIINDGGLWCDRVVSQRNLAHVSIAHQHIKDRRAQKNVPIPPHGVVADYVPFYFAPRSPMLYSISRGNVEGYQGGQSEVLHLVSSAEAVLQSGLPFVFTDGHAEMSISHFYQDLQDLDKVDWNIMRATIWRDTNEDGDRKRRRQAEFLVHEFFPFSLFERIGVATQTMAKKTAVLLAELEEKPLIEVQPTWYY
ncbi:MAG TPA: DUF4433 domain-containing protein [Anaerolineales bacterium]|nr:DUF4433 domain-containing protein [Chloroflexota bacterium]WKZ55525.1 MAG: DUF4433 domain-containing protein [Anaerolineales bacterium]GJQ37301.1 MAG: hypothetical protein JETCAE01_33110 [Anaerolineaceae bacterium]NOG74308.1 DUF4433 domain-containing protein [Chloroflexota bacterium]GIK09061.1 MAG: hypothetical protein BroJett001_11270 [Chloroflexota bacterium]